jgi:hypothetical protein
MNEPKKYNKFCEEYQDCAKAKLSMAESGDKSQFCSLMMPLLMSTAIHCVAVSTESTTLAMSAALMRTNTRRYVTIPKGADLSRIYEDVDHTRNGVKMSAEEIHESLPGKIRIAHEKK